MGGLIVTKDTLGQAITEFAESNEKVVALDADLAKVTASCKFKDAYPNRFFGMGIVECDLVGTVAGLSAMGKILLTCTFVIFTAGRALKQAHSFITYFHSDAKICGNHSKIPVGKDSAARQATKDLAVIAAVPSMVVLNPGDAVGIRVAVRVMIDYDNPVYIRLEHNPVPAALDPDTYCLQTGEGIKVREGKDMTLIAMGSLLDIVSQAAEELLVGETQAEVINTVMIKSLDKDLIVESARKTQRVAVLEEGVIVGGPGSVVAHMLSEQCPVPVRYIGIDDCFDRSGDSAALMECYGMAVGETARKVKELL